MINATSDANSQIRYVAKFRYTSENSLCIEIAIHSENFAIVGKFRYNSEDFAIVATFRCNSENFSIVAKFRYNSEIAPAAPACSWINFFIPGLMQSKINHSNSM